MNTQPNTERIKQTDETNAHRSRLLAGLPVEEHRLNLAGISTSVLVGGEESPMILLHGPGESSLWWLRTIPRLVTTNRVIVPDLPGHGESLFTGGEADADLILPWLGELIEQTCPSPPVLVGNILGGSIAARFAIRRGEQIRRLVLVDSLGLAKFRPAPKFAFGLLRFMIWPTEKNYVRFMPQCMYDFDELRNKMGERWDPFLAYVLECARDDDRSAALKVLMKELGVPKIPSAELAGIKVPTALIWGRHDRANKLQIAERTSQQYGWPLHIIEETRDDPKLERPEAFTRALYKIMDAHDYAS